MLKFARLVGITSSASLWLVAAGTVLAQTATDSASKGGTSGALPNAGSTELTYLLFIGGALLFVVGTLKLILSFRPE
ncbi:hypothetical protein HYW39_01150 [Candidatus Curtissbacteria bacterium]|nr:hypothetical protein [Candidatus Curtissbacteria bacterium]MBI2594284.1 hypothetical protein [Candidatus Curtissbacteria bacterium]